MPLYIDIHQHVEGLTQDAVEGAHARDLEATDEQIFTDAQLLALIVRGENWALSEIHNRYARLVFSIALKTLNDQASAEEIVQQVFTEVRRPTCPGLSSGTRQVFSLGEYDNSPPMY